MASFIVRRSFVAMLLMYCCVTATLPLSNIHIESVPNGYGYVCGQNHQEADIHIRLHELFFSHFSNKSDHIRNISSVQLIKHKTGSNKVHLQLAIATDTPDFTMCFGSHRLTPYCKAHHAKHCQYFSVSGLSPPSA
jgi:hypothetical protein